MGCLVALSLAERNKGSPTSQAGPACPAVPWASPCPLAAETLPRSEGGPWAPGRAHPALRTALGAGLGPWTRTSSYRGSAQPSKSEPTPHRDGASPTHRGWYPGLATVPTATFTAISLSGPASKWKPRVVLSTVSHPRDTEQLCSRAPLSGLGTPWVRTSLRLRD